MKKLKQFFKAWWNALYDFDDSEDPILHPKQEKDVKASCPFCGYMGSSDEVRCHCINYHKR